MNYHCPICEANLRWRFYLKRVTTKLLKNLRVNEYAHLGACPNCKNDLGLRVHATDEGLCFNVGRIIVLAILLFILMPLVDSGFGSVFATILALALFVFTLGLILQLLERKPQPWRRYIAKLKQPSKGGG